MPSLVLANGSDSFDLDSYAKTGKGVQVTSGVTGLGLPPVSLQWVEGAGDGATLTGRRVTARDIDLPLMIKGDNRTELKEYVRRLSLMLAGPCTLSFTEEGGESWTTEVVRVGGGTFTYGEDTRGVNDLFTVVTVRAGDPYFTSNVTNSQVVKRTTGRGLLPRLAALRLTGDRSFGRFILDNPGTVGAYPVWTVHGPGSNFTAVSPTGERLTWAGTLDADDVLTIDTKAGTVRDQDGLNRYAALASAPRFWQIPPGTNEVSVSLDNSTDLSSITLTWRPRRWMVI